MRICYAKIHEIVYTQCSLRRARHLPFRELKPLLRVSEMWSQALAYVLAKRQAWFTCSALNGANVLVMDN